MTFKINSIYSPTASFSSSKFNTHTHFKVTYLGSSNENSKRTISAIDFVFFPSLDNLSPPTQSTNLAEYNDLLRHVERAVGGGGEIRETFNLFVRSKFAWKTYRFTSPLVVRDELYKSFSTFSKISRP